MLKVVIAAAGQGTRMQELTKDKGKTLIEVGNRPFLAYLLDNLVSAGYKDFILVVGFHPELMQAFANNYLTENQDKNLKINLVNQFEVLGPKEEIYGTACPVMCVKDIVGQNNFLYICGDNFYSVRDLKSIKASDKFNYVFGRKVAHPENFGVLKILPAQAGNGEMLEKIIEKPKEFVGDIINASLYKFTPEIFSAIGGPALGWEKPLNIKKSPRGEYEITDAINLLAKEGKVKAEKLQDQNCWIDFGRPDDIERFEKILKYECH